MSERKPCDRPMKVAAEDGEVVIDGPFNLVISLTPEAAEESSNRLYQCTAVARGQRIMRMGAARAKRQS
jgi:hypothetical protein